MAMEGVSGGGGDGREGEVEPEGDSQSMPTLGGFYHVERGDGSWHVAEVIQRRENPDSGRAEFYVHYKECECARGVRPFARSPAVRVEGSDC